MRFFTLVLVAILVPFTSLALVGSTEAAPPCYGYQLVPGQGPSCPVEGGWEVILDDGSRMFTHGPDPKMPGDVVGAPQSSYTRDVPQVPVACVSSSVKHSRMIYAYPSNGANNAGTMVATLKEYAETSNGLLRTEAGTLGRSLSYKFVCGSDARPSVATVKLGVSSSAASFSTIVSDLRAKGYADANAKYWVWYDGDVGGYCGQGSIYNHDVASSSNYNNLGNMFAITYGCDWTTMMHENGHNMGAVQISAPHSTGSGGWHCTDGYDIMCYADSGPKGAQYSSSACTTVTPFDCHNDDYFHPFPPAGSYLASKWNIGATYNSFLDFTTGCDVIRSGDASTSLLEPTTANVPSGCRGLRFSLVAGIVSASYPQLYTPGAGYRACWYTSTDALIRCDGAYAEATLDTVVHGVIPTTATRVHVTVEGAPARWQLILG